MNDLRRIEQDARDAILSILREIGDCQIHVNDQPDDKAIDLIVHIKNSETEVHILVEAKGRITPQTALAVCNQLARTSGDAIRLLYAPVISPRVDQIAKEHGIGFVDGAGNCRIRSATGNLHIERRGLQGSKRSPQAANDPFSPKSSRIVRAMLSEPARDWRVRQLAEHVSVDVSLGLVSKVKRKLIEEGFVIEWKRRLYVRDPIGLLNAWTEKYRGPTEQIPFFVRGDSDAAEKAVSQWCEDNSMSCRLAGFSAAWRLAPEVRYHVAQVYVEASGFASGLLNLLQKYGAKRVDSGANLMLWKPFDRSALAFAPDQPDPLKKEKTTSPIQTYLDLKTLAGRGEEAADALYSRWLEENFRYAADKVEEIRNGRI